MNDKILLLISQQIALLSFQIANKPTLGKPYENQIYAIFKHVELMVNQQETIKPRLRLMPTDKDD